MPQKLELNQVISFILDSKPEIITVICTIAITHIMLVKFNICDAKRCVKELDSFFEEMDIINQFMYHRQGSSELKDTSVDTAKTSN